MEKITIPDSVTSIDCGAFSECLNLRHVELSRSITKIPAFMFNHCASLSKITIESNIEQIEKYAFRNTKIREIDLSKRELIIEESIFEGCLEIKTIKLKKSGPEYVDKYLGCEGVELIYV